MRLGLNADPIHWDDPRQLAAGLVEARAAFAVFPFVVDHEPLYGPFGAACEQVGIEPIPVLVLNSMTAAEQAAEAFDQGILRIQRAFPGLTHIVLGNEPDAHFLQVKSDRSWDMTAAQFQRLLRAGRDILPNVERIAGGSVSGQPKWWHQVTNLHFSKRHAHLYAQDHNTVRNVLSIHSAEHCRITWALEFGFPISSFASEGQRARELSQFLVALAESGIENAAVFRYSDKGDPAEQFGLINEDGTPRESLAAFRDAAAVL